jgi:hypothetical protein
MWSMDIHERISAVDLLKQLMNTILEKYHLDPTVFSGRLSFEIEVKDGKASIINHSLVSDTVTLH